MNPEIWGPHYWFVIHSIAFNYPNNPNALQKKDHYKFIQSLPEFIPDKKSSKNFAELLKLYSVVPYLDSRKDFVKWTHFIHNRVNESLGKDEISIADFYYLQNLHYNPTQKKINKHFTTKLQIYFFTLALLLLVAHTMSKKKHN